MRIVETNILGEALFLHAWRAVYWQRKKMLLISDLHLGKATHFRKQGIPVPRALSDVNWDKLMSLLLDFQPERVLFLGDLFHSDLNEEWEEFCQLTAQFSHIRFELVPGNHDILLSEHYINARLILHPPVINIEPFIFSHHPLENIPNHYYNVCGHLHPSVCLRGNGRQKLRLPCFYFAENQGILPAFGAFTGTAEVQPRFGDQIYLIAEDAIFPFS
ncbi:MAG: ligase-associated DNA damage response endonuclease PdeM [Saprospiraceae bacterium]